MNAGPLSFSCRHHDTARELACTSARTTEYLTSVEASVASRSPVICAMTRTFGFAELPQGMTAAEFQLWTRLYPRNSDSFSEGDIAVALQVDLLHKGGSMNHLAFNLEINCLLCRLATCSATSTQPSSRAFLR